MTMLKVRRIGRRGVLAGVAGLLAASVSVGVAVAMSGVPEIDRANATMRLAPAPKFTSIACAGEDGIRYVTFRGGWHGVEVDAMPGSTDYSLSGVLTISKVTWTVNTKTSRGALAAAVVLTDKAGARTYAGTLRLITQGLPSQDAPAAARGFLVAPTYTNGVSDGGSLLANVELRISSGFSATGQFGDSPAPLNTPDYSVTTANQVC
jgi:hypothetical protein